MVSKEPRSSTFCVQPLHRLWSSRRKRSLISTKVLTLLVSVTTVQTEAHFVTRSPSWSMGDAQSSIHSFKYTKRKIRFVLQQKSGWSFLMFVQFYGSKTKSHNCLNIFTLLVLLFVIRFNYFWIGLPSLRVSQNMVIEVSSGSHVKHNWFQFGSFDRLMIIFLKFKY